MNNIDLSRNNLTGEIPESLTNLLLLFTLNLSWNHLTGKIPKNIGALHRLETLDLSSYHLSGPIPPTMSSLNFLSHLNLSYNNLFGKIPYSPTPENQPHHHSKLTHTGKSTLPPLQNSPTPARFEPPPTTHTTYDPTFNHPWPDQS